MLDDLCHLQVVLGEDHLGVGVAEDEADILVLRRRVDRRGGAPGAHDCQVGEDPLDPGARGDRYPILRPTPSASSPAARSKARSLVSVQVSDTHPIALQVTKRLPRAGP